MKTVAKLFIYLFFLPIVASALSPRVTAAQSKSKIVLMFPGGRQDLYILRSNGQLSSIGEHGSALPSEKVLGEIERRFQVAAFSPQQRVLAVSDIGTIHLYKLPTLERLLSLRPFPARVVALEFDPLGESVAASATDGRIYRWRFVDQLRGASGGQARKLVERYVGHSAVVRGLAFHPFAKLLFSGDWSGVLTAWQTYDADLHDGLYDRNLFSSGFYTDTTTRVVRRSPVFNSVEHLHASPDGEFLFVARGDGEIQVWRVRGLEQGVETTAHDGIIHTIALSEGGDRLYTLGRDGLLKRWSFLPDGYDPKTLKPGYTLELEQERLASGSELVHLHPSGHLFIDKVDGSVARLDPLTLEETARWPD